MTGPDREWLALVRGEHFLSFAATEAERQAILARWVLTGLGNDERFVYAEPEDSPASDSLEVLLTSQQFDTRAATVSGRLVRVPMEDFYAPQAPAQISARASADGFKAVRIAAHATHAMARLGRTDLVGYEVELARACESRAFSALCQYDPLSAGEWLTEVSQLHQLSGGPTPFFAVPGPGSVMLFGEIDATNSEALARTLGDAAEGAQTELRVDLDGLQLMSSAGCRAILEGTESFRARGGQVILLAHGPLVGRVLQLMRLGSAPGITVTDAEA